MATFARIFGRASVLLPNLRALFCTDSLKLTNSLSYTRRREKKKEGEGRFLGFELEGWK
jgi:hypothetical protein